VRVPILISILTLTFVVNAEDRMLLQPLITEALKNNPEILAAQKRYEAARQRPSQAASLPETMLSLGYASTGSPRPFAGLGVDPVANAGLMLSQTFPFPGKRKLRGEIAQREADSEFWQYQATQLSVIARVKSAYHRLHHTYKTLDLLAQSRDLLREILRAVEARYAVGEAAQQDLLRLQTQISEKSLRIERMQQEKQSQEAELNQLLARRPGSPLGRPAEPVLEPFDVTLEDLIARARRNSPLIRRNQKMIERSELAVNLARKEFYPDYTLSAGYFNMGRMPDMYMFRVEFQLPTSWRSKQRAGVAEQTATLSAARRDYETTDQALLFRMQDDYRIAETSRRLLTMYQDTLLPQARLTLESSLPAYQTGQVDLTTLLNNALAVLEYEIGYDEELLNYHLALIRLEEMAGVELLER